MSRAFDRDAFGADAFDVELWDIASADAEVWTARSEDSETWTPRTQEAESWSVVTGEITSVFSRLSFSKERYLGKRVFAMHGHPEIWFERSKQVETWT